jgi:raffinose/stachyose/melibiose transport system substrate-binding protein
MILAKEKSKIIRFATWSLQDVDYFNNKLDLAKTYKKFKPNVTIEIEGYGDITDYENSMKIRQAAGELPDVFVLKPYMIASYQDSVIPLNNVAALQKNKFARMFAVNGKIVGIPQFSLNEFVYYRKSIFKELGLSIPKTWDEFIALAKKIKANGKYIPIILAAKDTWPVYPFNEYMPCLVANNGKIWNSIAEQDEPFSKDQPFYKAYTMIQKLYEAKVFGADPFGVGRDQAVDLFIAKKGAMICAGSWFLDENIIFKGDIQDMGTFLLPVRNNANETLNTTVQADNFLVIPKNSKMQKEAIDFINWFFSKECYPNYITTVHTNSAVNGITTNIPIFNEAFTGVKVNYILYDGGNAQFRKIADAVGFDVKKMGVAMLMGQDLDQMMNELNKKWKEARSTLK